MAPKVSVILPSYNHEQYVEAAVRSVMEQSGVDFELIVIDDGSKDRTPEILKRLADELKFTYIHRPNKGVVATLNEALELAQGEYVCSFSSDDIMPPDRLKKQSDFLDAHPDAAACFGQIVPLYDDGSLGEMDVRYLRSAPQVTFEESFLGKKALHGCGEMFVREKILAIGGYDKRYFFEDYPLYLKILYNYGPQPVSKDFVCCYYREHGDNLHLDHERIFREIIRILSENYSAHPLYKKAVRAWKANWFSAVAVQSKLEALRLIPKVISLSPRFWMRLPKLFIPKIFLKF
ncbi:glycosyltransferase family 2 protein [Fibrobacter sp. UBA4297]|uniref:glycosyltransferase family 2 protein n=1 Tax=Fibrobacter sp. UBA4297 TaxID=1946536 RepID=UPI0025BACF3A|nr:glycosyltransferase family 2 protein [Fibrobacter sp. UBA4297]